MNKKDKIGIFDSGIGGVTVLKEIIKILPKEDYIYYSDSINNPYGDKEDNEIINICDNNVKYLIDNNCKIIVIACNTATAKAIEYLRNKYNNIKFIGIEPAYKMVYDYSFDNNTLVMATRGTIESERFKLLYKKYDNHKTYLVSCVGLADKIEEGNIDLIKDNLIKNIGEYKNKVTNVVLGCTHYPLVKKEIKEILGSDIKFFYGAPNLAIHLKNTLIKENLLNDEGNSNITFIDSSNSKEKEIRFFRLLDKF